MTVVCSVIYDCKYESDDLGRNKNEKEIINLVQMSCMCFLGDSVYRIKSIGGTAQGETWVWK